MNIDENIHILYLRPRGLFPRKYSYRSMLADDNTDIKLVHGPFGCLDDFIIVKVGVSHVESRAVKYRIPHTAYRIPPRYLCYKDIDLFVVSIHGIELTIDDL